MYLTDFIVSSCDLLLNSEYFPLKSKIFGHNGPYNDPETPVRLYRTILSFILMHTDFQGTHLI